MNLRKTLENYISAQQKYKEAKHELGEAEIRLEMECRKIANHHSKITDGKDFKLVTSILLGKLQ